MADAGGTASESGAGAPAPQRTARRRLWRRAVVTAWQPIEAHSVRIWRWVAAKPGPAHVIRAVERFSDRAGNQFAAAITYFSFLSLVPITMVGFAVAGYALAFDPDLMTGLKDEVLALLPGGIGESLVDTIDKAVGQRLTVGIVGLLVAAYSGFSWMGNVREAVRALWRPQWERTGRTRDHLLMGYLWDLISLLGLLVALLVTFSLTAIGTAAQDLIVRLLGLHDVTWLGPLLTVGPFVVAIAGDMIIFSWVYTILPYRAYRADRRTLLIGALAMSVCFEVLKTALTIALTRLARSPSWAVFGSIIGLLLFFNLAARAFLMVAAWIATAVEKDVAAATLVPDGEDAPVTVETAAALVGGEQMGSPPVLPAADTQAPRTAAAFVSGAVLGWLFGRRRRGRRGR